MKNKVLDVISGIFALILIIGVFGLIIWGIISLIIGIINIPKQQEETKELRTTEITVESKDKTSSGMSCITYGIMTSCEENFKYKINNFDTSKSIFESVEIGKKYKCERDSIGSNRITHCEEE